MPPEKWFAPDSSLEGTGFELLVPLPATAPATRFQTKKSVLLEVNREATLQLVELSREPDPADACLRAHPARQPTAAAAGQRMKL